MTRTEYIWTMGVPTTGSCISMQILQRHLLWQQTITNFQKFSSNFVTGMSASGKCWHADMLSSINYSG